MSGMIFIEECREYLEENSHSATLSITNLTWTGLSLRPVVHDEMPATNVYIYIYIHTHIRLKIYTQKKKNAARFVFYAIIAVQVTRFRLRNFVPKVTELIGTCTSELQGYTRRVTVDLTLSLGQGEPHVTQICACGRALHVEYD